MKKLFKSKKGFTLVELMVVITVIAILATIAVVSFTRVQKQARDTKRKSEIKTLQEALQAYYTEKNTYPVSTAAEDVSNLTSVLTPNYVSSMPISPSGVPSSSNNKYYMYITDSEGSKYGLCAGLEVSTVTGSLDGHSMWWATTLNGAGLEVADIPCTPQ